VAEIEQRHQRADISDTFAYLVSLGYKGWFLGAEGLRPLDEFDVARHQKDHLLEGLVSRPAAGYVNDFVFLPMASGPEQAGVEPSRAFQDPAANVTKRARRV